MRCDVVIVGGGIIGSAAAYELASQGVDVTVFDDPLSLGKATRAATGLLVVGRGQRVRTEHAQLLQLSLALFEPWIRGLEKRAGKELGFRRGSVLRVARTERESTRLRLAVELAVSRGEEAEWFTAEQVREAEPLLAEVEQYGAARFEIEAVVEPERLLDALRRGCQTLGVRILPEFVKGLEPTGLGWRVYGEERKVETDKVVLAAGFASIPLAQSLGLSLPLIPVRGISIAAVVPLKAQFAFTYAGLQVVPRQGTKVVVGSTLEKHEGLPVIAPAKLAELKRQSQSFFPWMARRIAVEVRCGVRPGSAIGRPIVAKVPRYPGLSVAVGHYRSGVVLAPLTGQTIREILFSERLSGASLVWRWPED